MSSAACSPFVANKPNNGGRWANCAVPLKEAFVVHEPVGATSVLSAAEKPLSDGQDHLTLLWASVGSGVIGFCEFSDETRLSAKTGQDRPTGFR
jgi:hypothetical protein